jgi:TetR/AcrR family transcriptional repressor of nem operon
LLDTTRTPKGSFYHHFKDKEDFALQVLDTYMSQVHAGMDACLRHTDRPPLTRVWDFFEMTQKSYREEGYMGCLIGGLGQELSGVSDVFRQKISQCFSEIASEMAICLEEARQLGELPNPASLNSVLDFYFLAVTGVRQRQDAS